MTRPEREDWGAALAAADPAELAALAGRITDSAQVEAMAPPREGLMLMRLRDSVAGAAFHLGEVPVARVHLRLSRDGRTAEGGAVLMSDDLARVTRIEAPEIEALIAAGQAARARLEADRALVLDRTRVDFQLLSEEDE
jgi:alpha-D-ribose 1-methylphosphonate 5-triphosphate synthase subunit PhnG